MIVRFQALTMAAALFAALNLAQVASAQTSTKNLTINGGTGAIGTIGGTITATVKSQTDDATVQTGGALNITDLDIRTVSSGGFLNFFPNSNSQNNTAVVPIAIANTAVGITIPTAPISSPISGSVSITAGDTLANGIVGVIDNGVPGSDGAWDDPTGTGILNNATVNSFTTTLVNDISSVANLTGGLGFTIPNDVTIPNVVDTLLIDADLRLKNSSTVDIVFDPIQNIALKNFSISSSAPLPLNTAVGNFVEASHPTGFPQSDLSVRGIGLIATTVSGVLAADLTGTVVGSIDLAADLTIIGLFNTTVDLDNVLDGNLSDPGISLLNLNEAISLPDIDLPFSLTVLHEPTADVDFDDILAMIQTGTFGFEVPVSILEEATLNLPSLGFQLSNQVFPVSSGLNSGDVIIDNLEAEVTGQVVLEIIADLVLDMNVLTSAFEASAINVIPEPTSFAFLAISGFAMGGTRSRRRRS